MRKRMILLAIPICLLPYLALFTIVTVFFSTKVTFFKFIMETVFQSNGLLLIAAFFICCLIVAVISIVYSILSIYNEWDPLSIAKTAMIVKLIQLPAYIMIFIVGAFLILTIFTIFFSIGLFLFDCLSLFITGILVVSAVVNSEKKGVFKAKQVIWVIIMQFIFCLDVISSIVFYIKLKKALQEQGFLRYIIPP